ncbi:MAG: hypothetical protein LAQ30_08290 [Acidobacteriia bacterium]|nr:hypothetical protein [Terriglobia bacterium]
MPEKKKTTVIKSAERRIAESPAAPAGNAPQPVRATVSSRSGAAAVTQPVAGQRQLAAYEAAMRLFHLRQFREARELFVQALEGPERDIAQRAQLRVAMCDRRLEQPPVALRSVEDYYNYGVALINARNIPAAREHLETALKMSPGADHIYYALALAQALGGDPAAAYEHLKRAIELEPRNRILARQDADLAPLAGQPPFDALLYPEKKNW